MLSQDTDYEYFIIPLNLIQKFWFDAYTNTQTINKKCYKNDINIFGFIRVNIWKKPNKIYSITSRILLTTIT